MSALVTIFPPFGSGRKPPTGLARLDDGGAAADASAVSALRNMRDKAAPVDTFSRAEISLTAASTSASMSSVVLMNGTHLKLMF